MNIHNASEQAFKNGYAAGYAAGSRSAEKCTSDVIIKPDGVHELSPHKFELVERLKNVTVEILRCKECGEESVGWYRQEDTEEVTNDD